MGKRYKKGNIGKRRNRPRVLYFRREKLINHKIKEFKEKFYNYKYLNSYEVYVELFMLKSEIKQLLYAQEDILTSQSYKRRSIYYKQLSRFKMIYARWKNKTRFAFFSYVCAVPPWLFAPYL